MAVKVEDLGELLYGGLVTATRWWDGQRVQDGKIKDSDLLKKVSLYAYLIPGGAATIMSAFGVWRKMERWNEHLSHGFIYDFPGFLVSVVEVMRGGAGAGSAAVNEANRILRERADGAKQLTQGQGRHASRSYQREFDRVIAF